jgi:hypothetical protein
MCMRSFWGAPSLACRRFSNDTLKTMPRALQAGFIYFVLLFGLGFLLGSVRLLLVQHGLGRTMLVLIELPIMLAYAWWVTGWAVSRFAVPAARGARLVMGGVMFGLLRLSEMLLGAMLMGIPTTTQLATLATPMGAIELAAQIACAFFPLLHAKLLE